MKIHFQNDHIGEFNIHQCIKIGYALSADVSAAKGCTLDGGVCRITEFGLLCLEAALSVIRGGDEIGLRLRAIVFECCCCALTVACLLRLESENGCALDWENCHKTELSSLFGCCDFCGPNMRRNGTDPACYVLLGALSAACFECCCCCCCVFCGWKLQMAAYQAWENCRKTEYFLCLGTAHNAARVCDEMGLRVRAACCVFEVFLYAVAAAVGVLWSDLSRGCVLRLRGRGLVCVCRLLGQSWAHLILTICIGLALVLVLFFLCRKLF